MTTDLLVVFVDGFPFEALQHAPFLRSLPTALPLVPGMGYSVNIQVEEFAGLSPDDVGYFCEWQLDPRHSPVRPWRPLLPLLDRLGAHSSFIDRGLHRILGWSAGPIGTIPFRYLLQFSRVGKTVYYPGFPHPTVFSRFGFHVVTEEGLPFGRQDAGVLDRAYAAIADSRRLFLPLGDLDGVSHHYGVGSPEWLDKVSSVDRSIHELFERFSTQHHGAKLAVVSDHGMCNVVRGVKFDIETQLGQPGPGAYWYFADSTMLRVWTMDPKVDARVLAYLTLRSEGRLLTAAEREQYGIRSPSFGQHIFLLDEGLVFAPGFFGYGLPAAMHGYDPCLPSQKGILASNLAAREPMSALTARGVYQFLCAQLSDADAATSRGVPGHETHV